MLFENVCGDRALLPGLVCTAEEAKMAFSDQQAAELKTDFTARVSYYHGLLEHKAIRHCAERI